MNDTKTDRKPSQAVRMVLSAPIVRVKALFLLASFASFVLSVSLWFTGHELQGIFVGVWVPSILSFGALVLAPNQIDIR